MKAWLAVCVLLGAGSVNGWAAGEEAVPSYTLDGITVEGEGDAYYGGNVARSSAGNLLGEKDVMDNPFTTVTLTEKTIEDYSDPSQPISSILINDPSVRTSSSTMYNDFSIRGLNLNGYQMYLNGVPGLFAQNNLPVNFIEKVEVTSGPNMTINAATPSQSAGGTVNLISKRAGEEDITEYTQGFSGSSAFTEQLDISKRFGDEKEWGIRVNAMNQDGELAISGEKLTQRNIFINVDHKNNNSTSNLLLGYRYTKHEGGLRWFGLGNKVTVMPDAPDSDTNFSFPGQYLEYDQWIATLNHEQKVTEDWSVFFNGGYTRYDLFHNVNSTSSKYTIINNNGDWSGENTNWSRPLNITSYSGQIGAKGSFATGDVTHQVVLAVDKAWYNNYNGLPGGNGSNLFSTPGGNIYTGVKPGIIGDIPSISPQIAAKSQYWSWKVMDTMEYGKAQLLVGVNKQYVSNEAYSYPQGTSSKTKTDGTSPVFGLVYKPNDRLALHASHSESFDKGTVVGSSYLNAGEIISPAKTTQNEIGVKWEVGNVLASLTAFEITQDSNIDVASAEEDKFYLQQDGKAKYKGVELSAYGALTDKWNIMGGVMYLDAVQEKTKLGVNDGKKVAGTSEWSGVVGLEYKANDRFSVLGRAMYVGTASLNNEKFKVPAHLTFDLGIKYKTQISHTPVTLSAMCYNVTDKNYWIAKSGVDTIMLSNPRTFVLSAAFEL